jgi:UDP-N-acetylglucosamine transferase subunit ALG13
VILGLVGTHHEPMPRLVSTLDRWAASHPQEQVVIQAGSAAAIARHAEVFSFVEERVLSELVHRARVVVTHGGPTVLVGLVDSGRIPIVMPRERRYHEHVDDHQVDFAEFLEERGLALVARDERMLEQALAAYDELISKLEPRPLERPDPELVARAINELLGGVV